MNQREMGYMCLGVLFGLAAGGAAGLLSAPHSGRHTRRRLRRAGEDIQDRISETGEEWLGRGRDFVDEAAKTARRTVARASA
jgi:gas vesicle protein